MVILNGALMLLSDRGLHHYSHFIGFIVSIYIRSGFLAEARHY